MDKGEGGGSVHEREINVWVLLLLLLVVLLLLCIVAVPANLWVL